MDAARHAPVSLPSGGSFDRETLQAGLDQAVDAHPDKRDDAVRHALESARSDAEHTDAGTVNAIPGHKLVDAEVQLSPGTEIEGADGKETVGAVTVTETRQVVDPDADQDVVAAASGGQPVVGNRSEILSTEDAEPADAEAADTGGSD